MTFTLFHFPGVVYEFLLAIGAAALGFIGYLVAGRLLATLCSNSTANRLDSFASSSVTPETKSVPVGSQAYKVRLAFSRFLDVSGREDFYLWTARLAVGGTLTIVMFILGLPIITSLIGLVAGYVLVDGMVTRSWNRMRTDIEAEIPAMLSGMKSAIGTAPNVPQALADTAKTLKAGGPLRSWCERAASQMHSEGQPCIEELRKTAASISSSLAVCVELISRMWTTGGKGYAEAFENAASNLRDVLSARVLARARGAGAQSTTNLLMGMAFAAIVFLNHSPSLAATVRAPLVQVAYAGIFLMIIYGYNTINEMIENAV